MTRPDKDIDMENVKCAEQSIAFLNVLILDS